MPPCLFGGKFSRAELNLDCRDREKVLLPRVNSKEDDKYENDLHSPPNKDGESVTKVIHVIVTSCRPPELNCKKRN